MVTTEFVPRRPSRRADLARVVTSLTIRPLERVVPSGPLGVAITRRILASLMLGFGRPVRGVRAEEVEDPSGVRGEWARPDDAVPGGVILYVHGSAYVMCSVRTHRPLVTTIAQETGLPVFSLGYRLAPEHPFPAAVDDVAAGYRWLLGQGWRPDQVVLMGDSAGGHLILDLALDLRRRGDELPAAMVMFSPLADVTFELSRGREQIRRDPMISAEGARRLVAHYVGETDPLDPRLTHVLAATETLCPTLIQAGGAEMMAADAHHVAALLRSSGTSVQLEVWPGQMHVFQAAARAVPEGRVAIARAARFVCESIESAQTTAQATAQTTAPTTATEISA